MHDTRKYFLNMFEHVLFCLALTHPDFSKASLAQFELQSQGLPRNLPGVFSKPLSLRLDRGAHRGQPVAKAVGVLCDKAKSNRYITPSRVTHTSTSL